MFTNTYPVTTVKVFSLNHFILIISFFVLFKICLRDHKPKKLDHFFESLWFGIGVALGVVETWGNYET